MARSLVVLVREPLPTEARASRPPCGPDHWPMSQRKDGPHNILVHGPRSRFLYMSEYLPLLCRTTRRPPSLCGRQIAHPPQPAVPRLATKQVHEPPHMGCAARRSPTLQPGSRLPLCIADSIEGRTPARYLHPLEVLFAERHAPRSQRKDTANKDHLSAWLGRPTRAEWTYLVDVSAAGAAGPRLKRGSTSYSVSMGNGWVLSGSHQ